MATLSTKSESRASPLSLPVTSYLSWGRNCRAVHRNVYRPAWIDELGRFDDADAPVLAYGLGRSYGDSCLNDGGYLIDTSALDHVLAFDTETGVIRCSAGVSLATILQLSIPRGWFLPVTPGTKFVTVAGAVANDVHGKNHHCAGTIGCHVTRFELLRSDGNRLLCSPRENAGWFAATIGGLGLTGILLWVELQLKPIRSSRIVVDTLPFHGLDEFLDITSQSEAAGSEYTVAWIDCLAGGQTRGIFYRGNHAEDGALKAGRASGSGLRVPFTFPGFVLSRLTVKAFNTLYYHLKAHARGSDTVSYDPFFYPLDGLRNWNLIYGPRGLVQYQCVVPEAEAVAFQAILAAIADSGQGSFLGVIKKFGALASPGLLSFPRPGLTLALDFPARGEPTQRLLDRLDGIVRGAGGAIYPAKDSRMNRETFEASFPRLADFRPYLDPHMSSGFWRRVQSGGER
jgi:FAD/FMN-containing dehydrogenase